MKMGSKPRYAGKRKLLSCAALLGLIISGATLADAPIAEVYAFTGGSDGASPYGQPVEGADGYLYGTTSAIADGGCCGSIYRIKTDGTSLAVLHSFTGGDDGASPHAALLEGTAGEFYGVTDGIGASGNASNGTVFKITADGTLTTLHVFTGDDGYFPVAALIKDDAGNLYGTTEYWGPGGDGTVFRIGMDGSGFTILHSFTGGADGGNVAASLIRGSDGRLYGTTHDGGANGLGTVFSLNPDGSGYSVLHSFANDSDGRETSTPLVQAANGTLYGTTDYGGGIQNCNCGTIYQIAPDGSGFATLHSFAGGTDGADPINGLSIGANGKLYGATYSGVVFEFDTDGSMLGAYSLDDYDPIANDEFVSPSSALTLFGDGRMYGVTMNGGAELAGTIYSLDPLALAGTGTPATVDITVAPSVVQIGDRAILKWSTSGATACTASGAWSGDEPLSGTALLRPTQPGRYVYALSCTNSNGFPTTATATLIVKR